MEKGWEEVTMASPYSIMGKEVATEESTCGEGDSLLEGKRGGGCANNESKSTVEHKGKKKFGLVERCPPH